MLSISHLSKEFGSVKAVEEFTFSCRSGAIVTILAPSGAGKTTLLRLIAGLDTPTKGLIFVAGKPVVGPDTSIGFIFQEPSAFPWLRVRDNLLFGLRLARTRGSTEPSETEARFTSVSRDLGLDDFLDRFPSQISGGQKQRVVLARTLVMEPLLLLCDEPFSSLDEFARQQLREVLLDLHAKYGSTIVFVTHSVEEALFLGTELLICAGPPLTISRQITIPFGTDRNEELLATEAFMQLCGETRRYMASLRAAEG